VVNLVPPGPPLISGALHSKSLGASDGPIEGNPGHYFGMSEMFIRATNFPYSAIGFPPDFLKVLQNRDLKVKVSMPVTLFNAARVVQSVPEFSKDIQLHLGNGSIANTHRRSAEIAAQPRPLPF